VTAVGVLYDYFRAPDDAAVEALMAATGGGPVMVHGGDGPVADVVDAKGIDPTVILGQLVAMVRGVEWSPHVVDDELVWPEGDDEESEGPWVVVLDDLARDTLADIADGRLPELADRWSGIEELAGSQREELLRSLTDLVNLARRARAASEHLYCWMSL
jgi:hypothetical protein